VLRSLAADTVAHGCHDVRSPGGAELGTTAIITTVQYVLVGSTSTPVASVANGNTSGFFSDGCQLTFAIGNGSGVCETPFCSIPADYPIFLDGTCGAAAANQQFGTWGTVITITMGINCPTDADRDSWGRIKLLYR